MLKKGILAFMMMGALALANPVKIVFDVHTGSDAKFQFIMNNLRNLTHNTGNNPKNLQLYLVFYGPAIKYMLNSLDNTPFTKDTNLANNLMDMQMQLQAYQQEGVVHFRVCHESLNAYHISPKDVVSFAKVVPAGILEIAKLEREGYAYIRP
jgi:hypothetical protein